MMDKILLISFTKLHGAGNDFIISEFKAAPSARASASLLQRLAKAICDRHCGVGADGFLYVQPPRARVNDACVRFFNADGSEAEISGNGLRCVGGYLRCAGNYRNPLRVETLAGTKPIEELEGGRTRWKFRVAMGLPVLQPGKIPFAGKNAPTPVVGYSIPTRRRRIRVTVTSMGNPHCSVFVNDFNRLDWLALGREIEVHPFFPKRTNVEFVKIVSRREVEVRYWERGVGITASSGTGSCGAVVASVLNGFCDRSVRVRTLAGGLRVEWPENSEVFLTGPAHWIAEGTYAFERAKQ